MISIIKYFAFLCSKNKEENNGGRKTRVIVTGCVVYNAQYAQFEVLCDIDKNEPGYISITFFSYETEYEIIQPMKKP